MQTTKRLSIMMSAVTILLGTFFIVFSVIAASNTFKIISAEITEKSTSAQATIVDFDDTVINNNVEFYALDDYVVYTIGLENTGTSDARITSLTVNNNNSHIIYDYTSTYDTTLGPDEVFSFNLKAIYSSALSANESKHQDSAVSILLTFETGDGGSNTEEVIIVPNTGAAGFSGSKIDIPTFIILTVIGAGLLITSIFLVKHHKVRIAACLVVTMVGVVVLPMSAMAMTMTSDHFTLNSRLSFFGDCDGICYDGNGDDGIGLMADQIAQAGDSVTLMAPNFSRAGYGFAGWNTRADGTGTNYGPNEVITMPDSGSLWLHANWIKSAGNMVGFDCETLSVGSITALSDVDGQVYAVAKLADHNCWTIENSRIALTDSINENTENRSEGTDIDSPIYSYGNYYTEDSARNDEICPTGWRLPSGDDDGDYKNLESALNPDGTQTIAEKLMTWISYPNNFVLGGLYYPGYGAFLGYSDDIILRGNTSYYFGSDALYDHGNSSFNVYATALAMPGPLTTSPTLIAGVQMVSGQGVKMTARCVTGDSYAASLVPHNITLSYDANGGTNAPAAQTEEVTGRSYTFTITDAEPTRYHYDFRAWVEESNKNKYVGVDYIYDDEKFYAGDDYTISADTTLYALWEEKCVNIHYMANDSNAVGEMGVQTVCPPKHNVTLIAPNYSLAGHSYTGWNTKADGTGTMYGPNEYIALPAVDDLYLYAQWIEPVTGLTMQTFNGTLPEYANAAQGTVIALRDERDNEIYTIAKLRDGHWWMTENLRLDLNDPNVVLDATNTNNPTEGFLAEYNADFHGKATNSTIAPCATLGDECEKRISFTVVDTNRNYPASFNDESNMTSWYAYGGHYNWYTATAGHGEPTLSTTQTDGDICPLGWRLPTGRSNGGETVALDKLMGGNGANNHDYNIANNWLSAPTNVVLAGSYSSNETGSDRGYQGKIWTSSSKEPTSGEQGLTIVLNAFGDAYFGSNASTTNKWYALSVRCIAN